MLTKLDAPADPLAARSDWTKLLAEVAALFLSANSAVLTVAGGNIVRGSVFQIGGVIYYAASDTAISEDETAYVKITGGPAEASAAYVEDLDGVSWNSVFNGWYDGDGALYVFDEAAAIVAGEISEQHEKNVTRDEDGVIHRPILGSGPTISGENGFFAGSGASATDGGAIGQNATATTGGAVGKNVEANSGFAGGTTASATGARSVAIGDTVAATLPDEATLCGWYSGIRFFATAVEDTVFGWLSQHATMTEGGFSGAIGTISTGYLTKLERYSSTAFKIYWTGPGGSDVITIEDESSDQIGVGMLLWVLG